MKLTTKGRYAVTAMIDLALYEKGPVSLSEIAGRQSISQSYLEQLFSKLRRKGLVKSVRGAEGGYRLAQPKESISVADIMLAIDESVDATSCGGEENCQKGDRCLTHDLWANLNKTIFDFLNGVTLAELAVSEEAQPIHFVMNQDQSRGELI